MYAFLLVFGAVVSAAGLAVVASGVSVQAQAVDASIFTSGAIAVVGGGILMALAVVVRTLLRLERALTVQPMPRPAARPGEAAGALTAGEAAGRPARIPFPPKPKASPQPQAAAIAAAASLAPAEDAALEHLPEKSSTSGREHAPVVEDTDVSLSPKPPARRDVGAGEVNNGVVVGRAEGGAPARTAPVVEVKNRASQRPERAKSSIFDSLWPKTQRPTSKGPMGAAAPAAPLPAAPPMAPPQPAEGGAPLLNAQSAPAQQEAPAPVSILKSGVVEGMAYTLYSDGSIEAQLPQGTLRFGSITELRNHIEQSS